MTTKFAFVPAGFVFAALMVAPLFALAQYQTAQYQTEVDVRGEASLPGAIGGWSGATGNPADTSEAENPNPSATGDYWTPERIRDAKPIMPTVPWFGGVPPHDQVYEADATADVGEGVSSDTSVSADGSGVGGFVRSFVSWIRNILGFGGFHGRIDTTATFEANPARGPAPLTVQFSSSINDPESYTINFGDGTVGAYETCAESWPYQCSLKHTYTTPGTYTAQLVRHLCPSNADGCLAPDELAASVRITVTNGTKTGMGTLAGRVTVGPTCPVESYPPDLSCAPQGYQTTVTARGGDGRTFSAQTDADGYYRVSLRPGTYEVSARGGSPLPSCSDTQTVRIRSGSTATANISCDSGIR